MVCCGRSKPAAGRPRGTRDMYDGLYSIHVTTLDGHGGKGSGVIAFHNGRIFGGDAYLYYSGTYTLQEQTFKGEVVISQHTRARDVKPLFGSAGNNQAQQPVGVGISGVFTATGGEIKGAAFQNKQSLLFAATLNKLISLD